MKQVFTILILMASLQAGLSLNAEGGWRSVIGSVLTSPKTWVIGSGVGAVASYGVMCYFSKQQYFYANKMKNMQNQSNITWTKLDANQKQQNINSFVEERKKYSLVRYRKNIFFGLNHFFAGVFLTSLAWLKWGGKRA